MNTATTYRLEKYKTAFLDYEAATRKFHEGVLALTLERLEDNLTLLALRYDLGIKHQHLVRCADRLVDSN